MPNININSWLAILVLGGLAIENNHIINESLFFLSLLFVNASLFNVDPFDPLFLIIVRIYACYFKHEFPFRLANIWDCLCFCLVVPRPENIHGIKILYILFKKYCSFSTVQFSISSVYTYNFWPCSEFHFL